MRKNVGLLKPHTQANNKRYILSIDLHPLSVGLNLVAVTESVRNIMPMGLKV